MALSSQGMYIPCESAMNISGAASAHALPVVRAAPNKRSANPEWKTALTLELVACAHPRSVHWRRLELGMKPS